MTDGMLIDDFMPRYDFVERHEIVVRASPSRAYAAARSVDLASSTRAKILFGIRGLPHLILRRNRLVPELTIDSLQQIGFVTLAERPDAELVLGVVGKFWRLDSGILSVPASEFVAFERPGFMKSVINIYVHESTAGLSLVGTETRVVATDEAARQKFGRYWRLIGPFSALIRHWMLGAIKKDVEARGLGERSPT